MRGKRDWGGWGRTSNLPVNSRALCRLSYTPRRDVRAGQGLYLCVPGVVKPATPGGFGLALIHLPDGNPGVNTVADPHRLEERLR